MTVQASAEPTAGAVWGRTAFQVRAAIAAMGALYTLARFGLEAGLKIALAAGVFVALDAFQQFRLGRGLPAAVLRPCLIGAGLLLLIALLFAPVPWSLAHAAPGPVLLESPLFVLLLCLLASYLSADRPALVWQVALGVAVAWIAALLWTSVQPGVHDRKSLHAMHSLSELLAAVNAPRYLNFDLWRKDLEYAATITAVLGLTAWRMHRLARRAAGQQAQRDSLAAHFSPQVVADLLARRGRPFEPQERVVAVLESDLVGFTRLAETLTPEACAELLGRFRAEVESAVFAENGAILGWVGDGVTAVFGLDHPGPEAAVRALACARRLRAAWPGSAGDGGSLPALGIGIDHGPAVLGLVGEGRSVSLLLTGAPVRTAARLQAATRQAGAAILLSESVHAALTRSVPAQAASLTPAAGLEPSAWRA